MENELPKLQYDYDALEPYIDEKTMMIHHDKHHRAYFDKLKAAISGTKFAEMDVDDILKKIDEVPDSIRNAVKNNGGGHSHHRFFWEILKLNENGKPKGKIATAIAEKFGTFDKFKEEFSNAAKNHFGSGWAWLVVSNGKLEIITTPNQDSPFSLGKIPILGIDVWEHAYYLKYQNKRAEYVDNFWEIINWDEVGKKYEKNSE